MNAEPKRALITGASQRIGKAISEALHQEGYDLLLHFRSNKAAAETLCDSLNAARANSAQLTQADLSSKSELSDLIALAKNWGDIGLLINNAASFYDDLANDPIQFSTNASHPYELALALSASLGRNNGLVINLLDIYADKPKQGFAHYSASKAAAQSYTLSLAQNLAPHARANGVAPGAILWPEDEVDGEAQHAQILNQVPLRRVGSPEDIVKAVFFLIESDYITGQVITVDGGRSLNL
jgi:pteridine reductase